MEELLAQLLQKRALETKAASDEKYGPMVAQLRGMSERQGYLEYDSARVDASNPTWTLDQATPEQLQKLGLGMGANPRPRPTLGIPESAGDGARTAATMGLALPDQVASSEARQYERIFSKPALRLPGSSPVNEPMDLITDASLDRDDAVQQTGWLPSDFNGMSEAAAIALIADQLRTRRIRQMGELSPDYLETQPIY